MTSGRSAASVSPSGSLPVPTGSAARFSRWERGIIGLLLAVPLFLVGLGLHFISNEENSARRAETARRLEQFLSEAEPGHDPTIEVTRFLQTLERRVFAASEPASVWAVNSKEIEERFPGRIATLLLDGRGEVTAGSGPDGSTVPRALLRRLFAAGRRVVTTGEEFSSGERSIIRSFLGPFARVDLRLFRQLQLARPAPQERYVYLSRPSRRGMFLLFLDTPDSLQLACVEGRIKQICQRHPGIRLGLIRPGGEPATAMARLSLSATSSLRLWPALEASPTGMVSLERSLVARQAIGPETWVIGRIALPGGSATGGAWEVWMLALVVGVLPLWWPGLLAPLEMSVRTSLVCAFLYAVGVPSVILGLAVQTYLAEQRTTLEDHAHQEVEKQLIACDKQMQTAGRKVRATLERLAIRVGAATTEPLATFRQEWPALRRLGMDSCQVFDRTGRQVFDEQGEGGSRNRVGSAGRGNRLARSYLRFFGSQSAPGEAGEERESAGEVEALTITALTRPVVLGFLEADDQRSVLGFLPLLDDSWQPRYVVLLRWSRDRFEELYLKGVLQEGRSRASISRLQAFHVLNPARMLPPKGMLPGASTVITRLAEGESLVRGKVSQGGDGYLLTGLRGLNITCFSLVAATSDRPIRAVLADLAWRFSFAILVLTLISLTTSLLLTRSFLGPVRRLTEGLAAIQKRRFEHRVGIDSPDELGGLGTLFDGMMEGLADLEVARAVQEQFFPREPLRCGGWEIAGLCRTASRVGGDYFDHFTLPDDRVFLFIGDVTGHGIGAALVTALAKATVLHPATAGRPEAVIAALRQVMSATARVRRLMTCHAAVLDTRAGVLTIAGGAHPWPFLIRRGQPPCLLEVHGKVIGMRIDRADPPQDYRLEPDDAVVFFSDGVTEAVDAHTGRLIDTEGLQRHLPGLLGPTAHDTAVRILDWVRTRSSRDLPEDDLTVLVIQGVARPEVCQ